MKIDSIDSKHNTERPEMDIVDLSVAPHSRYLLFIL